MRIWRGEVPLGEAFWGYAILYGSLLNLVATGAALALMAAGLPIQLGVAVFFLPIVYSAVILVGVWRSADRFQGERIWADLAKLGVVAWAILATLL
jgi:hypothetical protein